MYVSARATLVVLLAGCRSVLPVSADSGGALDAGVADAGVSVDDAGADAGVPDSGVLDAGTFDAGHDAGVPSVPGDGGGSDAGPLTCAAVTCAAWSRCIEDGGPACVPTVTSVRWVLPALDAAVPIDTIRLMIAVELNGRVESIPVRASGAGRAAAVVSLTDAGLATGGLSLAALDAGLLVLTAGWSGGPEASTTIQVLPSRGVEVVGPNPPSHGANTADFEPNDPEGNAWRRDDVVPFRAWPGVQVIAAHLHPDASATIVDAGEGCDGGCASLRLQDVEFNAFRGVVELRVVSDAGWEARGERLTVTRWRWRRAVAGVPSPIRVQTPVMTWLGPNGSKVIAVGTEDSQSTGRLVLLTEQGLRVAGAVPQSWSAAVTAPVDGCWGTVAAFDGDAGFLWRTDWESFHRAGERYVLLGGADALTVAVTDRAEVIAVDGRQSMISPQANAWGTCPFDGGEPTTLASDRWRTLLTNAAGEVCLASAMTSGQGSSALLPVRATARALALKAMVVSNGALVELETQGLRFRADAGSVADTILNPEALTYILTTPTPELVLVQTSSGPPVLVRTVLRSRIFETPVYRRQDATHGLLFAVDASGRLAVMKTDPPSELWSWRPDGGLSLSAPMGTAPSDIGPGSLLIPTGPGVLSVIAEGEAAGPGSQSGGDPANCGGEASGASFP